MMHHCIFWNPFSALSFDKTELDNKACNFVNKFFEKASRRELITKLTVPSIVFNATLPVNPSVTTTSVFPEKISLPSINPM